MKHIILFIMIVFSFGMIQATLPDDFKLVVTPSSSSKIFAEITAKNMTSHIIVKKEPFCFMSYYSTHIQLKTGTKVSHMDLVHTKAGEQLFNLVKENKKNTEIKLFTKDLINDKESDSYLTAKLCLKLHEELHNKF